MEFYETIKKRRTCRGFTAEDVSEEALQRILGAPSLFAPTAINSYNTLAGAWCMIDHLLLAAADEGLGCSLRIPVGSESADVAAAIGAPEGWVMPCYIGLGHPSPDEPEIEQITPTLEEVIHRGKW